jgi:hypothetical protein
VGVESGAGEKESQGNGKEKGKEKGKESSNTSQPSAPSLVKWQLYVMKPSGAKEEGTGKAAADGTGTDKPSDTGGGEKSPEGSSQNQAEPGGTTSKGNGNEKPSEPEKKRYLPDFESETLKQEIIMLYLNFVDTDEPTNKYRLEVQHVDRDVLQKDYKWVNNYDTFLYMLESLPVKETKFVSVNLLKLVDQTDTAGMQAAKLAQDPFLQDIPMDRKQFYALVNAIQKEEAKQIEESRSMDLTYSGVIDMEEDDDEGRDGVDGTKKAMIAQLKGLDGKVFDKYDIVYKFGSAYFDISEFFNWVTERPIKTQKAEQ